MITCLVKQAWFFFNLLFTVSINFQTILFELMIYENVHTVHVLQDNATHSMTSGQGENEIWSSWVHSFFFLLISIPTKPFVGRG